MKYFNFLFTSIGYESYDDFVTTIIGFKFSVIPPLAFTIGGVLSAIIEKHIWANVEDFYFLGILVALDLATGIWKSIKFRKIPEKRFQSSKLSRVAGKLVTYTTLLYVSYNLGFRVPELFWLPRAVFAVFAATEAWSLIENFSDLGYLNKEFVKLLKEKLDIRNIFKLISRDKNIPENDEELPSDNNDII